MNDPGVTRRSAFWQTAGALAIGGMSAATPALATSVTVPWLDLADPKQRVIARAKAIGSVAEETVYVFYRLHLYGFMNGGNLIPFFTMNNLSVTKWKPLANGNYLGTGAEAGVYCRFDTDQVLDV